MSPPNKRGRGPLGKGGSPTSKKNRGPSKSPSALGKEKNSARRLNPLQNGICQVPCKSFKLREPFLIGFAVDNYLTPEHKFTLPESDFGMTNNRLMFGQDYTFGRGRKAPEGKSVSKRESMLKTKMLGLIAAFALKDASNMSVRLIRKFLGKAGEIRTFQDKHLNLAVSKHPHFKTFANRTVGVPGPHEPQDNKIRIHQALKRAAWDINQVEPIVDLGVPAFNRGSKVASTKDFSNGLGLMVNGVQYVLVYAEKYHFDCNKQIYDMTLRFVLYDVFGLDDEDLIEYGADSHWGTQKGQGITAWWQLQHQFGYAPLVTRMEVTRTFPRVRAA